ncbi:protein BIG GRAIN 1-like B [Ricinus communis]|uniref:Protein BIG GRAIN 1-like A n=1 Tax=Ricinus communis TaxID=3988 RepID=B9RQU8_RICCO|nr:protein BIG GRAIN 1-like B [Ricinus communis]EEF46119.1 conserved hypothetical protein [Ricinus communis]|eukprot:XP_002516117.1 protein BIG GRAIN 1-like B [Ricinus communis]
MHKCEKEMREDHRHKYEGKNPSFSSSLLDEIYRSICEGDTKHDDLKFYRETMPKKQNKDTRAIRGEKEADEVMASLRRACLIEKWMEQKVSQKVIGTQHKKQNSTVFERKSQHDHDIDQDVLFFSSTSSSSDSSFGGFSSSDTESIYGARSGGYSFAPARPKPVRTSVSARSGKTERTLFYEQRELHMFDDYHCSSAFSEQNTPRLEENIIKSKSRALKIYNNLKKVKQPISPGGKLANFINSLFTTGNTKKSKNSSASSIGNFVDERKFKSAQASSTCSSASSFSRSCLSKNSPSTREKLRNGVKRNVTFYPVSVIVDEDCRPCGHKSLYEEEEEEEEESSAVMSVSLPRAWKIGKSPSRKVDDELKYQVIEKSRRAEDVAREFLKDYHQSQKKMNNDDVIMRARDVRRNYNDHFEDEDEDNDNDNDDASCSSSDLFELDHLSVIGKDRYCQELPVYETTHVSTNRAIANGLIM